MSYTTGERQIAPQIPLLIPDIDPQIGNPLTPSKNATGINPAAFSASFEKNGDEENRPLGLLHELSR